LSQETPEISNSGQGSHFTSPQYIDLVQGKGAKISMDGRGGAMDNIFAERSWRSVKYEEVDLKEYESPRDAKRGIGSYLNFHNRRRPHQSLGYKTSEAVYYAGF